MALISPSGNPDKVLDAADFTTAGETKTEETDLALVVGSARRAEDFVANRQWALLWSETDILFQAPRPLEIFEGSYVLSPNVQRFTIAKVVNAIVPQLFKGLFFEDPPMVLRPRPGTSQDIIEGKTALASYLLDACNFKREVKWGLEQLTTFGTGIWKWGVEKTTIKIADRVSTMVNVETGSGTDATPVNSYEQPKITFTKRDVCRPTFEFRPLNRVLIDPELKVSDIREARYVIDVWYMNYYQLRDLKKNNSTDGKPNEGWDWGEYSSDTALKSLWEPPIEALETQAPLRIDAQARSTGVVHHAAEVGTDTSADPLAKEMEVLEYWDKTRKRIVLNRKKNIFKGENPHKVVPFLSANWWNRPKAFYGMGVGLTVGQNQRVDQGTINAILKILSFSANPVYLRSRDSNSPTQMIRTGIGRILSVDGPVGDAYRILEQPKVPADIWSALANSESNTESTTGADQTLIQGSTAGPRTGMGRSATGASALASASATRLDGPLDNFIDQVFAPFLYILDDLVYNYMSDGEIMDILGEELGEQYKVDLNKFHKGKVAYEVLAGSSLAAKRTMAQAMPLLTQFYLNPQVMEFLAKLGKYVDVEVIGKMWMESSEWKDRQDLVKKMPPEMLAAYQQQQQAQSQQQLQNQMTLTQQKGEQKEKLEQERFDNRVKENLLNYAIEHTSRDLATTGEPTGTGFGSDLGQ